MEVKNSPKLTRSLISAGGGATRQIPPNTHMRTTQSTSESESAKGVAMSGLPVSKAAEPGLVIATALHQEMPSTLQTLDVKEMDDFEAEVLDARVPNKVRHLLHQSAKFLGTSISRPLTANQHKAAPDLNSLLHGDSKLASSTHAQPGQAKQLSNSPMGQPNSSQSELEDWLDQL